MIGTNSNVAAARKAVHALIFVALALGVSASDVCALVAEGTPAHLECPPGERISSFSFATFGTFAPASSCADSLFPYPACPTSVLAQVGRLCVGSGGCNVSCDCDALPAPCGCVSSAPSLDGAPLRLAFPGVPCSGVAKQLGVRASCAPALPPPAPQPAPPGAAPTCPLLEFLPAPVHGVDTLTPHFAWTPPAAASRVSPAAAQSAARVVVAAWPGGAPVWDSGAVPTSAPLLLPVAPLPLLADAAYTWTVATADSSGAWSPPSAPARFTTGLLAPGDWGGAAWIGAWRPGTLLRKDFTVAAAPARVSAFASGCQYYLLFIDGARVGGHELDVAWTRFPLFRSYASYDVDPALLAPGQHTLGLALGQGFCGQSGGKEGNHTTQGLLRLALHAADGSLLQAVVTDTTWSAGRGPVLSDSTYFGENYDATMEQPGWAAPGFVPPPHAPPWAPAVLANDPPTPPRMSSQLMPAIERVAILAPLSVTPVAVAATTCEAGVSEGQTASFSCPPAEAFNGVVFSSFGTPTGSCGALRKGSCDSANSTAVLVAACVGRSACSLAVSVATFGGVDPCLGTAKTFAASMTCAPSPNATPPVTRYTYDFGQQVSGRVRLSLPPTQKGTNVTVKHAEAMAHPPYAAFDGSAWMGNLFWAFPVDSYITSGAAGGEVWEPSFTDHGFRYAELSFDPPLAAPPGLDTLSAVVLRTAARPQTAMLFGNALLQALSNSSWWTESSALKGIPQGCGARGERCGWTGDAAFASESELTDFDSGAFFTQWALQLQQLQCSDGSVGSCMPNSDPHRDGFPAGPDTCKGVTGDPSWGTVYPTVVWGIWKYYNAVGVAKAHYPSILDYYNMVEANVNASGLKNIFCTWGDWNPIVRTDCHVTAAASYLHDLAHLAELAGALGRAGDAALFSARLASRRAEYHAAFWNAGTGLYGSGTQVAQAVALWTGVAAGAGVAGNVSAWLANAVAGPGGKLTFGFIGVRYVFEALALNGQVEAALRTLLQTGFPSYGYELYHFYEPMTTLWETWDAPEHRQWLDESSRNHHYQASINTFLRKHVVGLDMPLGAAAWSTVAVRPFAALPLADDLVAALPHARATVAAYRGVVEVSWARVSSGLSLNATLPTGTAGTVSVPKTFGARTGVSEGGAAVWRGGAFVPGVPGVLAGEDDGAFVTFTVTSGAFVFAVEED